MSLKKREVLASLFKISSATYYFFLSISKRQVLKYQNLCNID
ncbi:hypothetical protein BBU94A_A66 (plasmid) [Borreliella burgdorferi 94a]|nr:hypothetical protein BBU94A_A66 [Borreliella burgdorferi 94a]